MTPPKELSIDAKLEEIFNQYSQSGFLDNVDGYESYFKEELKSLFKEEMIELIKESKYPLIRKHDDIPNVWVSETEENVLRDCNSTEAECFNSGVVQQLRLISLAVNEKMG